jgi:WD40 repeat protein
LNPETKQIVRSIEGANFNSLCILSDGNLTIGQTDSHITIWDLNFGKLVTLKGHKDIINVMTLLANGDLASFSNDREIRIWFSIIGKLNGNILKKNQYLSSLGRRF